METVERPVFAGVIGKKGKKILQNAFKKRKPKQ